METNLEEIWKPIPGYERYDVSNKGRVWDSQKIQFVHLCVPDNKKDYTTCQIDIALFNKRRVAVHRLVIWAFWGKLSTKEMPVNHLDGNKLNNDLSNLELVTVAENNIHAYRIGLNPGVWKKNRV